MCAGCVNLLCQDPGAPELAEGSGGKNNSDRQRRGLTPVQGPLDGSLSLEMAVIIRDVDACVGRPRQAVGVDALEHSSRGRPLIVAGRRRTARERAGLGHLACCACCLLPPAEGCARLLLQSCWRGLSVAPAERLRWQTHTGRKKAQDVSREALRPESGGEPGEGARSERVLLIPAAQPCMRGSTAARGGAPTPRMTTACPVEGAQRAG